MILRNRIFYTFLVLIFFMSIPVYANDTANQGSIEVQIDGIENQDGHLRLLIFHQKNQNGFPGKYEKALAKMKVKKIIGNNASVTFEKVPYGIYAISCHHDQNNNYKVDKNWRGKPIEGVGVSNGAVGKDGPPKFADASFKHYQKKTQTAIKLRYQIGKQKK